MTSAGSWEHWIKRELVRSLQSKGKLCRVENDASLAKDAAYNYSHKRVLGPLTEGPEERARDLLASIRTEHVSNYRRKPGVNQHRDRSEHHKQMKIELRVLENKICAEKLNRRDVQQKIERTLEKAAGTPEGLTAYEAAFSRRW